MGIAYSSIPVVSRIGMDGTSPTSLRNALFSAFGRAGFPYGTVSGGRLYTITSPQGLQAKLKLDLSLGGPTLQFSSTDGLIVGNQYQLAYGPGVVWQSMIHAGCQIALSQPGVASPSWFGGIPFFPTPASPPISSCAGVGALPSRGWIAANAFRNGYAAGNEQEGCFGSDLLTVAGSSSVSDQARLQIVPVTECGTPETDLSNVGNIETPSGNVFLFDPLLMWGSSVNILATGYIKAQLWDAVWRSMPVAIDTTASIDGFEWSSYNAKMFGSGGTGSFGSLMLLGKLGDSGSGRETNSAY